jgi:hypothetical protein
MGARRSLGRSGPVCQVIGCREPAAATVAELIMPATAGLGLELKLCPIHRSEVERGLEAAGEAVFQAGLEAHEAVVRPGWVGMLS